MNALIDLTSYSSFTWKTYSLLHGEGVLKIGTDAILLGTWLRKVSNRVDGVIDSGCGSGILSIMAAAHFPSAKIIALDLNETAVALTAENAMRNGLQHQIQSVQADLLSSDNQIGRVDLVISNPPFFYHQLPSPEFSKRAAKHAVHTPGQWMSALSGLAHHHGRILVIVPYDTVASWIAGANEESWYCQQRLNVYSFSTDVKPVRSLLMFGTILQCPETDSLVMYDKINCPSDNYQAWLK